MSVVHIIVVLSQHIAKKATLMGFDLENTRSAPKVICAWVTQKKKGAAIISQVISCLGSTASDEMKSFLASDCSGEPIQTFVQTIASGCTRRLNKPLPITHVVKTQFLRHFGCRHRVWKILLVSEHKHNSVPHLVFVQHFH